MTTLFDVPEMHPHVAGIDLWQANAFIIFTPQTAAHLYSDYTSLHNDYIQGTLPTYERVVACYTRGLRTDREKAVALATKALLGERFFHPVIPPRGPDCRTDRGLEDEALLKSGAGWCNEQARVFARLCQVSGIPARIVFLFYADRKSGHVVAEFYANGRWSMADPSWALVFPGLDGHLMSAAECHEAGPNMELVDQHYLSRMRQLLAADDFELAGNRKPGPENERDNQTCAAVAVKTREWIRSYMDNRATRQLWKFGLLNYPLPITPVASSPDLRGLHRRSRQPRPGRNEE